MSAPFWQQKTLEEMTDKEWESLCDGCGKCCLHKLIDDDTDELHFTNIGCDLLDCKTCSCKDYANRFNYPDLECTKLTRKNIDQFSWLPKTCAYRLLAEGKSLPEWHPLLTNSKNAMHEAGQSVRDKFVYAIDVIDWEDHILDEDELSKRSDRKK